MERTENLILFDMDGTLCDYDSALKKNLEELKSPDEKPLPENLREVPEHIRKRMDIIRNSEEWWETLPRFKLGWDILTIAQKLGYKIVILTQGPRKNPAAWSGKVKWIRKNLGDIDITITRDKSLVYGKILVDDFPDYVDSWLSHRSRGLVIMPAHPHNKDYSHPQVIRYDGTDIERIKKALEKVRDRKAKEPLILD